jgi:hypothetical protein
MMTIGKLLVFVNLFAAMALLTWTTSLSVNRLDWVDRKTETETVQGELSILRQEISKTIRALTEASVGYGIRKKELEDEEQGRAYREAKFQERLQNARSGRFNKQLNRVNDERLDRRSLIDVEVPGPAILDLAGQPLRGVDSIQADLTRETSDTKRYLQEITRAREQFQALSKQIAETDIKISDQRKIRDGLRIEREVLRDLDVNWEDELRLLKLRLQQLEQRLAAFLAPVNAQ